MNNSRLAARSQEQQFIQVLLQQPFFDKVGAKSLKAVLRLAKTLPIEAGDRLWDSGEEASALYVLLRGRVVRRVDAADAGVTIGAVAVLGEADLIGELPHWDQATAATQAMLLSLSRDALRQVFAVSPEIGQRLCRNVVHALSSGLQDANAQVGALAGKRQELEQRIRETEMHLNDLNTIKQMRG